MIEEIYRVDGKLYLSNKSLYIIEPNHKEYPTGVSIELYKPENHVYLNYYLLDGRAVDRMLLSKQQAILNFYDKENE